MERPSEVNYFDLAESLVGDELSRQWAVAVGRCLVRVATSDEFDNSPADANVFQQCWVGDDATVLLRYQHFSGRFGTEFGELELECASSVPLVELRSHRPHGSALRQAILLYHLHLNGGPARDPAWTDDRGYAWWGAEPACGWPARTADARRYRTLLS
ncbi:hypothetical protein GCM10009854_47960 [Saccharopolyspora halophila]|uniref:Uncharacterized protein n=1 Tax=Saccharopolyspora halophila TaxID=405551 RepID=A0ABN3GX94_9PSEU